MTHGFIEPQTQLAFFLSSQNKQVNEAYAIGRFFPKGGSRVMLNRWQYAYRLQVTAAFIKTTDVTLPMNLPLEVELFFVRVLTNEQVA